MQPAGDGASVQPTFFSFPRGIRLCRALFTTVLVCLDHDSLLVMWTLRNLKFSTCSTTVVLASHGRVSDLLPIGCLIVVCDQAYHWSCAWPCSHEWTGSIGGDWSRTPEGPLCWGSAWRMCCYLLLPPGGGPSGSPESSCRGRSLVPYLSDKIWGYYGVERWAVVNE